MYVDVFTYIKNEVYGLYSFNEIVLVSDAVIILNKFKDCLEALSRGDEYVEMLADKIVSNGTMLTILQNEEIIGFIAFYSNDLISKVAYITLVAVSPEHRGKSIGKKLILECIRISVMNGMTKIKLEVNKNNENAICFYKKCGFALLEECSEKSYFMQRNI